MSVGPRGIYLGITISFASELKECLFVTTGRPDFHTE
jgi:hypothetical protein